MDEIHVEKKHASTMRVCFLFCKRDYRNSTFTYMSIKIKVKLWVGLLVCCCCFLSVVRAGPTLRYKTLTLRRREHCYALQGEDFTQRNNQECKLFLREETESRSYRKNYTEDYENHWPVVFITRTLITHFFRVEWSFIEEQQLILII